MKTTILIVALVAGFLLTKGLVADLAQAAPEPQITYFGNGQKKNATTYDEGARSGSSEQWYSTGQQEWEGSYEDGYREGPWTFWLEDGSIDTERTGTYREGKLVE